ncbi:hypothetical protein Xsto_01849 [Xenorhabdus stockiae]|uniref:Uncharacterized protein n=1 Tax=Xenorhabdus stockiae TaxID=351614 RepID=A0A2D0KR40_9GAMM|nr:hypothetical protein [Xenorhabdus stockiae]PHM65697.1 hypothetical protein Xsto_01849 [Xenorhabdus stockiae]
MDYKYVHNKTKYTLNIYLYTVNYPYLKIFDLHKEKTGSFNIPKLPVDPRPTGIAFVEVNGLFRLGYHSSNPDDQYFGDYLKNNNYFIYESPWAIYDFHLEFKP